MAADRTRLTHANFFKLCEAMRKNKNTLLETRPSREEFVKWLKTQTSIDVSVASVAELKETTNIHWHAAKSNWASAKALKSAILAESVLLIAKELNVTLPEAFYETFGR